MILKIKNIFIYSLICTPILTSIIILSNFFLIRFHIFSSRIGNLCEDFYLYENEKKKFKKKKKYN